MQSTSRIALGAVAACGLTLAGGQTAAWAQQPPPYVAAPPPPYMAAPPPPYVTAPPPVVVAPAPPPAEAPAAPTALTTPSMTGPLVANPNPIAYETELGKVYLSGAISGFGMVQENASPGDHDRIDITNGHLILQKTDGLLQFYLQAGIYSFPTLGAGYVSAERTTGDTFSPVPVAWAKIAPSDEFSVQAGKLPTLIGAEYAFTFQNMNIERGLLWAQEPIVSRGIQGNYTAGPLAFSVSLNDGFYSDSYNWLVGSAAWTIDKANTLTVVGGGNFDHTDKNVVSSTLPPVVKTPFFQNNGEIFNLIYTYNAAPWTITPYFQYTHVPSNPFFGATRGAETFGGAMLANYAVNDNVNVAGRAEYIGTSGSLAGGNANVLYGPGSTAWSLTFTPTYQEGIFFVREELSYVQASSITPGLAFGKGGNHHSQGRVMIEGGIIF